MPKAATTNTTATIESLLPYLPGAPERPEALLDELHAGIGVLLQLTCFPELRHDEVAFIATALDGTLERLQKALRLSERSAL